MTSAGDIDSTLIALGGRGRYQLLQLIFITIGSFGAAYQLLDNIFIGRDVTFHQCSPPSNNSQIPEDLQDVDWNSSLVKYGKCQITVNQSQNIQEHDCLFGQEYGYSRELSFRTEFDLVCDYTLLGSLAQSFVIMGQGVGAVIASIISDRFGRKNVLVGSQFGLLLVGMGIGLAPSYAVLGTLKFIVGGFQQGVVTGMATMSIELFPVNLRHVTALVGSVMWAMGACSMTLFAYLMRDLGWRYLQYALSAVSIVGLLQLWYLDESLRWLVANGRKEAVTKVLKRAARMNNKNLSDVLRTLATHEDENPKAGSKSSTAHSMSHDSSVDHSHVNPVFTISEKPAEVNPLANGQTEKETMEDGMKPNDVIGEVDKNLVDKHRSVLDIFRHKRLLFNACIIWFSWFTCAFSFFALYMMSTSLHGNRFLNYFLTSIMEIPPGFIFFVLVNRIGRQGTTRLFYLLAGTGLISSGIFRIFSGNSALGTMSVVASMVGMAGASGMFGAVFFYTPEVFPTNMRNQALGVSSFAGRLGGMIAPFMSSLAEIAVWAPGVIIGSLCFLVVFLFRFLPETKGRELPQTMGDINAWYTEDEKKKSKK
ncbi:hypothetical protein BaRGS_00005142 [Batillaria attramentaria]|uniref:Major facilitator superfamily (MFS) profile domain-containing protein n=1 Tax=Batillaria attramentaria TaxID=370345 RepID=A0ABD0LW32_9CAEN